jgi:hypothetical protein
VAADAADLIADLSAAMDEAANAAQPGQEAAGRPPLASVPPAAPPTLQQHGAASADEAAVLRARIAALEARIAGAPPQV